MIQIYGKPACPSCTKAKQFCESNQLKYEYKSLGTDYTREELLEQFPTARTVPQIIINSQKIGGYENLVKYVEDTGYNGTGHTI